MLPRLIFTEFHNDPATARQLTTLIPLLKEQGYQVFFDEVSEKFDLNQCRKYYQESLEMRNDLVGLIDDFNTHPEFEIKLEKDMRLLFGEDKTDQILHLALYHFAAGSPKKYQTFIESFELSTSYQKLTLAHGIVLSIHLDRYETNLANLELLENIEKEKLIYKGIDLTVKVGLTLNQLNKRIFNTKRDKKLGLSWLSSTEATLGRVGMYHAPYIENLLLEQLSEKEVNARYCFINIRSLTKYPDEVEALPKPKNLVSINSAKMTDNDIISVLMNLIKEKQEAYSQLLPSLLKQAQEDLTVYAENLQYQCNKHNKNGLWSKTRGRLFNNEISVVKKLISHFDDVGNGKDGPPELSPDETKILTNKKLGKLISTFTLKGLLKPMDGLNNNSYEKMSAK